MKAPPRNGNSITVYTNEEMIAFWLVFNTLWLEPKWRKKFFAIGLIFCTGLRRNEARLLRVEDCHDVGDQIIDVYWGKGEGKAGHLGEAKFRVVDVLPQFVPHYQEYLRECRVRKQEYLFPTNWRRRLTKAEHPVSLRQLQDWWLEVVNTVGLRYLSIHAGRRTFTTYAPRLKFKDEEGNLGQMGITDLREQLGHAKIETTMRHYFASLPGTRFGTKKITWPDFICPQEETGADQVGEETLPDDPEILKAMIQQYKKRCAR